MTVVNLSQARAQGRKPHRSHRVGVESQLLRDALAWFGNFAREQRSAVVKDDGVGVLLYDFGAIALRSRNKSTQCAQKHYCY